MMGYGMMNWMGGMYAFGFLGLLTYLISNSCFNNACNISLAADTKRWKEVRHMCPNCG